MLLGIEQNGVETRGLCEIQNVILSGNKTVSVVCEEIVARGQANIICQCDKCRREFKINKRLFFYKSEEKRQLCEKCTSISTSLEKYGTNHPSQSQAVKEKQAATLEPYRSGEKKMVWKNIDSLKKVRKENAIKKWRQGDYDGIDWSSSMKAVWSDPIIRQKYIDSYNTPEALERFSNQLKIRWATDSEYRFKMAHCTTKTSKFQKEIYQFLGEDWELEYPIHELHYIVDIYNPTKNSIVECFGDYWHCNPNKYSATYFHTRKNMTAQQIWDLDKKRIEDLQNKGYHVLVVWEKDWFSQLELTKQKLLHI